MATPVAASSLRRTLLAGAAFAALGTGALATQDAQAAFTLKRCEGAGGVGARGASFQNALHASFKATFESAEFGCGAPIGPSYTSTGSGDGKTAMGKGGTLTGGTVLARGERYRLVSFAAADEAPTPTELQAMNAGPTAATADDGVLRVIPIATGASAFIIHLPEGCTLAGVANKTNLADGAFNGGDTKDRADNLTQRVRLSGERVEAAWAGDADATTWGDIVPGISGDPTGITGGDTTNAAEDNCAEVPVRRIVRRDSSGTTYGWKTYLHTINPAREWTSTYGTTNTEWPAAGGARGSRGDIREGTGAACVSIDRLCKAGSDGGGALARAVGATDGSIGYADLATARANGFDITASATRQDYTYWVPLEVQRGGQAGKYAEPTFQADAHLPGANKGASCAGAAVVDAPTAADPTLADWSRAYAAGGNSYPACVLTYAMAWDDNAPVYGVSASEEGKARTTKDYLELITSGIGQGLLLGSDYSPLPAAVMTAAQNGVAKIDWNKTSGGGTVDPPVVIPPVVRPPVVNPPAPPVRAAPSNVFSVPSSKSTASLITFSVQLPGAGALKADATARVGRRTIKVSSLSASASGAGRVTLRLKLSSAAKKALARAKGKKLKVAVKFTFTPTGGTANTVTRAVTVKAAARRATRRKAKR